MTIAKLTSKGQITIPKEVRDRLGLATGDTLSFVEAEGCFQIMRFVEDSGFQRYCGFLGNRDSLRSDDLVREMRGHRP